MYLPSPFFPFSPLSPPHNKKPVEYKKIDRGIIWRILVDWFKLSAIIYIQPFIIHLSIFLFKSLKQVYIISSLYLYLVSLVYLHLKGQYNVKSPFIYRFTTVTFKSLST